VGGNMKINKRERAVGEKGEGVDGVYNTNLRKGNKHNNYFGHMHVIDDMDNNFHGFISRKLN
jgi:hypothetical protein